MVSERKKQELQELMALIQKHSVIGILDLFGLPSKQLQSIRSELRGRALIRMSKKRIIKMALKQVNKGNLEELTRLEARQPALILTDMNPFKLYKALEKSKSPTYAKANDIAPKDIVVPEGPTNLMAGPAVGELQRVKIPVVVKEGKIHVKEDTVLVKEGDVISREVANVLKKLDIQPMEIGLDLLGAWENGIVYTKDVLAVSEEEYIKRIIEAHAQALNLAVNVKYPTEKSIMILVQRAFQTAKTLGINTRILETGVIEDLLVRADIQARSLKERVGV